MVEIADREAFVRRTGLDITDTDGSGGFVPAPPRERSVVVVTSTPSTRQLVGSSGSISPVSRSDAAQASGRRRHQLPILSDRTTIASAPAAGISVVQAVRSSEGAVVGFVTSGITLDDVLSRAGVQLEDTTFGLWMDGQQLTPDAPTSGATSMFEVAGRPSRSGRTPVDRCRGFRPSPWPQGTVALAIAVAVVANRDRGQQRRLARFAERSRAIAELAKALTTANDDARMCAEVVDRTGAILDGAHVAVARRAPDDPTVARIEATSELLPDGAGRRAVAGADLDVTRVGHADGAARPVVGSFGTVVSVPLRFSGGFTFGALVFAWERPPLADRTRRAVRGRRHGRGAGGLALERAAVANVVRSGAELMTVFAQTLAASHTRDDVRAAVAEFVPRIVGAESAELAEYVDAPGEHWPTEVRVRQVVQAPDNGPAGLLIVRCGRSTWRSPPRNSQ